MKGASDFVSFHFVIPSFLLLPRRFGTADFADGADKMLPDPRPSASSAVKVCGGAASGHELAIFHMAYLSTLAPIFKDVLAQVEAAGASLIIDNGTSARIGAFTQRG